MHFLKKFQYLFNFDNLKELVSKLQVTIKTIVFSRPFLYFLLGLLTPLVLLLFLFPEDEKEIIIETVEAQSDRPKIDPNKQIWKIYLGVIVVISLYGFFFGGPNLPAINRVLGDAHRASIARKGE
jgi:Na+/H+ antiporter NhaD/arsenite permease-like protein